MNDNDKRDEPCMKLDAHELIAELKNGKRKKVILDTDAYNEVDDQFAIAYAMRSSDRIELLSINAAPFLNSRSTSAGDGMEKSYREIFKITALTDSEAAVRIPVYRGSESFLRSETEYVPSDACDNIIRTVMESNERVWIVAIGAITNVASAIIKEPRICERAALIWLGGHSLTYPDTREFNLKQDIAAARVVFDSGISMVQIPCGGVCSSFITTVPELEYYLRGKNRLCDYLCDITAAYTDKPYGWSKVIWDVTAPACLTLPGALSSVVLPRPYITLDCRYAFDASRPAYVYVRSIRRDPIYADLFKKLSQIGSK